MCKCRSHGTTGTWSKLKKCLFRSRQPPPPLLRSITSSFRLSRCSSSSDICYEACAICLEDMSNGKGDAIFSAECWHSFHLSCIANSIKHGNYFCPICRSQWKQLPFLDSTPLLYSDDEPLLPISAHTTICAASVTAFPEFPAVASLDSVFDFAVLVGIRALPLLGQAAPRAPVDLVLVLDVSGSMDGPKLFLLKHAVCFVIDSLEPSDRLSIVSFSSAANRIFPFRRMSAGGCNDAKKAVQSLSAGGSTNIVDGLIMGARVIEDRRERNPVASIILLSDGHDSNKRTYTPRLGFLDYLALLPDSICPNKKVKFGDGTYPVHTFGFGLDHDSSLLHATSDASGGTFSFIESLDVVQHAFARCIGGLLSVVVRDARLLVTSVSPDVKISSIPSGTHASEISEEGDLGTINVGDLYADEEKEFLVHLSVPSAREWEESTPLMKISCSYKGGVESSNVRAELEGKTVEIRRPHAISPDDAKVKLEVDRERNRLLVAQGIMDAQGMAELGDLKGAQDLLANMRLTLLSSASAKAGDDACRSLETELIETRERMANMETYMQGGRAYALSGISSHSRQRSVTRGYLSGDGSPIGSGSYSGSGYLGYDTPTMAAMVTRSRNNSASFHNI